MATQKQTVLPGAIIGILGGGQLGMMIAEVALRLGFKTAIWAESEDDPGLMFATHKVIGPFRPDGPGDPVRYAATLESFRRHVPAVVTYEWENVPEGLVAEFGDLVHPSIEVLRITKNRRHEKELFRSLSIPYAPTLLVNESTVDSKTHFREMPFPAIMKTEEEGYDGKGQKHITRRTDIRKTWEALGKKPCVIEGQLNFLAEGSVVAARSARGDMIFYPAVENIHREGILRETFYPSRKLIGSAPDAMRTYTERIGRYLGIVGVYALECFIMKDGLVLANEIAPRVHNSGHGTIEGNLTSQFEQHVRAICGLPLGSTDPRGSWWMRNLIGNEVHDAHEYLRVAGANPHIYGKRLARPGRKMGHVTFIGEENR